MIQHTLMFLSITLWVSSIVWFGVYWNFLIFGDGGDMGTKKQLAWSLIFFLLSTIQVPIVTMLLYGVPQGLFTP